jgi:hypothetical protein
MKLSQAIPLLALKDEKLYLPIEISDCMPEPRRVYIGKILRRFSRDNSFLGYFEEEKPDKIHDTLQERKRVFGANAKFVQVGFKKAGNGRTSDAYSGFVWRYHAGAKSLQLAVVFSVATCLLGNNEVCPGRDLLKLIPELHRDEDLRRQLEIASRDLAWLYKPDRDAAMQGFTGACWRFFIPEKVREALFNYLVSGDDRRFGEGFRPIRPILIAAVASRILSARLRFYRRFYSKPKNEQVIPLYVKTHSAERSCQNLSLQPASVNLPKKKNILISPYLVVSAIAVFALFAVLLTKGGEKAEVVFFATPKLEESSRLVLDMLHPTEKNEKERALLPPLNVGSKDLIID